jgi:hypothetical protein
VVGIRVMTISPGTFITLAYGADSEQVEASIVEDLYLNGEVIRIEGAIRFGPKSPN